MTTWRKLISKEMTIRGDSWDEVEQAEISEEELDVEFYEGFGGAEGVPFTLWTKDRVYFPHEYDGSESVRSVSRDPNGKRIDHDTDGRKKEHICE
jgi:hypothetical protein